MYRVKSTMGDTVFQVVQEPGSHVIRSFYTESIAKEFCDKLVMQQYFETTEQKEKSRIVKEIEKIEIIRPKDFTREDKYHDQDYLDKWGNLMKKVYDEHKIIISGKTESNDDFSIEIAANGKEVGIKYNLPE